MAKIYKITIFFLLAVFLPLSTHAASLSLYPASGSYSTGDSFTVGVYVDSSSQYLNAASGIISFPADKLSVVSISKTNSIFSLWVEEPSFSNNVGVVSFEGIVLNPGFSGSSGKIITINFKVKAAGTANISFSSSSALANDGQGTNILTNIGSAKFTLGGTTVSPDIQSDNEKPSYFDVAEVPRQDETDPQATFIFNASDDIGINHYEIEIDGKNLGTWNSDESDRYKAPTYGPGKHTIIVKAVDEAGNSRSSTTEFFIKGLDAPILNDYPRRLQSGDILYVSGESYKNSEVVIYLQKKKEDISTHTIKTDQNGNFNFVSEDGLDDGTYELWVEALDSRGAKSLPTEKISIIVSKSAVLKIGGLVIDVLSVLIPLVAMVLVLLFIVLTGWRKIVLSRRKLHKEVKEAEVVLHKSFELMRDDLRDGILMLEKANAKRELTKEEGKILKQFKKNLADAEKFVYKEIEDIDKSI